MTTLTLVRGGLTMDDLEAMAFRYGGDIEPVGEHKARLVGAVVDGRRLPPIGPVLIEPARGVAKLGPVGGA
jgi:hypothetical protein